MNEVWGVEALAIGGMKPVLLTTLHRKEDLISLQAIIADYIVHFI